MIIEEEKTKLSIISIICLAKKKAKVSYIEAVYRSFSIKFDKCSYKFWKI